MANTDKSEHSFPRLRKLYQTISDRAYNYMVNRAQKSSRRGKLWKSFGNG